MELNHGDSHKQSTDWPDMMNDEMTVPGYGGSEHADNTGNTLTTDFTQVVSCAVAQTRHEQRRQKIREELVREHFGQDSEVPALSPSLRNRLLKLLKIN